MTNNIKASKLIKKAMHLYHLEQISELDSYSETTIEFSQEFETNMEKLLNSHAEKQVRVIRRKRFAKVAIVLTLAFLMLTAFAAREEIARFFVKIFDDRTFVSTATDGPDQIEVKYTPQYLLDGYTLTFEDGVSNARMLMWEKDGDKITFTQACSQSNAIYVDSSVHMEKSIDGMLVNYFETKHGRVLIIWHMDGYNFKLEYPKEYDWETIVQIVKSVEPEN